MSVSYLTRPSILARVRTTVVNVCFTIITNESSDAATSILINSILYKLRQKKVHKDRMPTSKHNYYSATLCDCSYHTSALICAGIGCAVINVYITH